MRIINWCTLEYAAPVRGRWVVVSMARGQARMGRTFLDQVGLPSHHSGPSMGTWPDHAGGPNGMTCYSLSGGCMRTAQRGTFGWKTACVK